MITDFLQDILDSIKYDIFKMSPPSVSIPVNKFHFQLHKEKDGYWIESDDLPGFYASTKTKEDLVQELFETLLVYYDIPRYTAKKLPNNWSLEFAKGDIIYIKNKERLKYA